LALSIALLRSIALVVKLFHHLNLIIIPLSIAATSASLPLIAVLFLTPPLALPLLALPPVALSLAPSPALLVLPLRMMVLVHDSIKQPIPLCFFFI